jgi:Flp pilus assembly protein TadB
MSDLITPVILASFGAGIFVIVFGFYILTHRTARSQYEGNEYYQPYSSRSPFRDSGRSRDSGTSYSGSFRRDEDLEASEREAQRQRSTNARNMMIVIMILTLLVVAVTSFFFPDAILGLFFLILFVPLVLQLIRSRRQRDASRGSPDRDRS